MSKKAFLLCTHTPYDAVQAVDLLVGVASGGLLLNEGGRH